MQYKNKKKAKAKVIGGRYGHRKQAQKEYLIEVSGFFLLKALYRKKQKNYMRKGLEKVFKTEEG